MTRSGSRVVAIVLALLATIGTVATAADAAGPTSRATKDSVHLVPRETRVWIPAGDHDIPGILAEPNRAGARPYPAALLLHGFASHKDEVGDMYRREARALAALGVASLRIDFAGTGDSEQPYTANTWTGMVGDAVTAYDWLVDHGRTIDDRVGVLGFSMGAKVGLGLIAERPSVAAFASWSGALEDGIPLGLINLYPEAQANGSVVLDLGFTTVELSLAWFDTMIASTPLTDAAGYTGPVLAIAGAADTTVDPSVSQTFIATVASRDKTLLVIPGADHIFNVLTPNQALAELTIWITAGWFRTRL